MNIVFFFTYKVAPVFFFILILKYGMLGSKG